MAIAGLNALTMFNLNIIAITVNPLGATDKAISRCINGCANRARNINACMHGAATTERIGTETEIAGEGKLIDWLLRGDRNRTLSADFIKLFPGKEQRTELRIFLAFLCFALLKTAAGCRK